MAKVSSIEKNNSRSKLCQRLQSRRLKLKQTIMNRNLSAEVRLAATLKLAQLPRNSAQSRLRNRCALTGRSRGYYRKFKLSRIAIRDLASMGMIPGLVKASW